MDRLKNIKQIIFDADDTLWENNIYYVHAAESFINLTAKGGFPAAEIEHEFDELEKQVVKERGYGSKNFVYILEEIYKMYIKRGLEADSSKFQKIIKRFIEHPVSPPKMFDKAAETMEYLKTKYTLFILTKGEHEEQEGKILRSGLDKYVNKYFILNEKDDDAYRKLMHEYDWQPEQTCMVGNSPKSDINPALRLGMYAVHIPYRDTWKMDIEPIQSVDGKLIVLRKFKDLIEIF
jgi:putative hydrolase of the HAD superfamily